MVAVLKHMSRQDGRHQDGGFPEIKGLVGSLNPDRDVVGSVVEEAKQPVREPHGALTRRGIGVRLEHSACALQQHESPYDLDLALGVP